LFSLACLKLNVGILDAYKCSEIDGRWKGSSGACNAVCDGRNDVMYLASIVNLLYVSSLGFSLERSSMIVILNGMRDACLVYQFGSILRIALCGVPWYKFFSLRL